MMDFQTTVNPDEFDVGVIIARFQVDELHEAHKKLIEIVSKNHNKIIIFLGVARVQNTKNNPLDFATRKAMIQEHIPHAVILPQLDNRSDRVWSNNIDSKISMTFGDSNALLYGSRDSFIPHYLGRHTTTELSAKSISISGTAIRNRVAQEILNSKDFRAGIIYATHAQRPITYSTVDIVCYNAEGEILLARKPDEDVYRFIGGFVDRTDASDEDAVLREFGEETGGKAEIGTLKYVTSMQIDDWRYKKEKDGIMTRLFIGKLKGGDTRPTDDIAELIWIKMERFRDMDFLYSTIMPEHQELFLKLMNIIDGGAIGADRLKFKNTVND